jgi:hypothetical protein
LNNAFNHAVFVMFFPFQVKTEYNVPISLVNNFFFVICAAKSSGKRRDGRVVEGARLESVYLPKADRGFESRSLRKAPGSNFNFK